MNIAQHGFPIIAILAAAFFQSLAVANAATEPVASSLSASIWFDKPAAFAHKDKTCPVAAGQEKAVNEDTCPHCVFQSKGGYQNTTGAPAYTEGLPIGNGRLGATDLGGVYEERVVLNESTVWSGSPITLDQVDSWKQLPEIRAKLFAGGAGILEADKLLQKHFMMNDRARFGSYGVLCDLRLVFKENTGVYSDYQRALDLKTGLVTTRYTRGGAHFTRELIASKDAEVILMRLKADRPGGLNFTASLLRQERAKVHAEGQGLVLEGQLDSGAPKVLGVSFQARLGIQSKGGKIKPGNHGVEISGADEVTLMISAGTDMFDKDFRSTTLRQLQTAEAQSFDAIATRAKADHQALMDRCSLDLPASVNASLPTPARTKAALKNPILPLPRSTFSTPAT
jgi:alpha-L-fucosidase 2